MPNIYLPGTVTIPSALLLISATRANPMVITVSIGNSAQAFSFIPGMAVKLVVPRAYGMIQADGLVGIIQAVNGLDLTLNINSSGFDEFVIPSGNISAPASICPAGSRNLQYNNGTSESVPFQSLNDVGN